jgi:hypothetical protein
MEIIDSMLFVERSGRIDRAARLLNDVPPDDGVVV